MINEKRGITLIALIITIIVLLILAGVSLNAIVGDNGIISNAQTSSLKTKFANYKEEMEINLVGEISQDDIIDLKKAKIIALDPTLVKKYIPSLSEQDLNDFGIISGKLYYMGEDELSKSAAQSQGIEVISDDSNLDEFVSEMEEKAIKDLVSTYGGNAFKNGNDFLGEPLVKKTINSQWKIIIEVKDNNIVKTYDNPWYYVQKGTNVDGIGELKENYIIDYDNKLAVQFDATKHSIMTYEDTLAVSDNLIFNADPTVFEEYNKLSEADRANFDVDTYLGEGIEFHGYYTDKNSNGKEDEGEIDFSQAFNATSFIFDGEDDWISFPYDSGTQNGSLVNEEKIADRYWQEFIKECESLDNGKIIIGMGSMGQAYYLHYSNLECYSLRLYRRPLTSQEVKLNYDATVYNHDLLLKKIAGNTTEESVESGS